MTVISARLEVKEIQVSSEESGVMVRICRVAGVVERVQAATPGKRGTHSKAHFEPKLSRFY